MHLRRTGAHRGEGNHGAWLVWGLAAGFYLVALFHRMSLGVASLDAQRRFDLAPGTIATLSALQLGLYLVMTIPAGLAADRIGPRRALAIGLVAMAIGETAFGLATSAPLALGGRALVGAGDAFMFLSVLRIAQNWFPVHRYAMLASLTGLAGALGQIGTTVPLGLSLDGAGWTATFVTSGLVTGALAIVCLRAVRDRPAGAPPPGSGGAPAHDPILRTLRAAWARRATRHAFWAHFGLMGPFVAITALWGYPYLVQAQDVAPGVARTWLMICVTAFAVSAPLLGAVVARAPWMRTGLLLGTTLAVAAGWAAALLWPGGHPPAAVLLTTLVITGAGGACAMLAFDVARAGNPAHSAGGATGLANTGGFSAAVAVQLAAAGMLHLGAASIQVALLPMLALLALACVQGVRFALAGNSPPAPHDGQALPRATRATPTARTATPAT